MADILSRAIEKKKWLCPRDIASPNFAKNIADRFLDRKWPLKAKKKKNIAEKDWDARQINL